MTIWHYSKHDSRNLPKQIPRAEPGPSWQDLDEETKELLGSLAEGALHQAWGFGVCREFRFKGGPEMGNSTRSHEIMGVSLRP